MRILAPVFEAGKVDLVFNGHVHNYQRTYPMTFVPAAETAPGRLVRTARLSKAARRREVDARQDVQRQVRHHPEGVIYVVTGPAASASTTPNSRTIPPPGRSSPSSIFPRIIR